MKKFLLMLAVMLLTCATSFAERTWLRPAAQPLETDVTSEDKYFYNVEYGGFLCGANDWGTRASVARDRGLRLYVYPINGGIFRIGSLSPDNAESVWIDGARDGNEVFDFVLLENNRFNITNSKFPGTYLTWTGDEGNTRLNFTESPANGTWYSVSVEEYERYIAEDLEAVKLYFAALPLKDLLEKSSELGIDDSSERAVYNNDDATIEQLNDAIASLTAKLKKAQDKIDEENGIFTGRIVNNTVTGATGWTCERPVGGNGPMLNGSAFEYWGGNATSRQDAGFNYYQTISGLPAGKYVLGVGMYNASNGEGAGHEPNGNAGLYIANGETEEFVGVTEDGTDFVTYQTQEINVYEGDDITIGVKSIGYMSARWFVADNFTLVRTGDADAPAPVVAIEESEGVYTVTSTSVDAALYYLCKPMSWLDDGETPESCLQTDIEGMGSMIDSEATWELYDHMGMQPAPKAFTVADYQEVYAGEEMFLIAANVGWDGEKFGVISNIEKIEFTVPEPEPEPLISEAAMIDNGVETALNDHSEVSVEKAEAVAAKVASSVRGVSYAVRNMMEIAGEESSQWIATDTIVAGDMSINGTAYAELDEQMIFEVGNKYVLSITAKDADENEETVEYIINGAYSEPLISEAAVALESGEEIALNSHSEVSVEQASAVAAKVASSVREASYAVRNMMEIAGEESSQWIATDTIAAGEMSINGTAFAEFDEPIIFEAGSKYMITIKAEDADENEESVDFIINGAYAETMTTTTSLMLGEDEIAINDHSSVSVESADAIKVQVENEPSVIGFTYAINAKVYHEAESEEEDPFWTVGAELAVGEGYFNGGTGYAPFENDAIYFEQGSKYQVTVSVMGGNPAEPAELATYTYEINGTYIEPLISEAAMIDNSEEIALNDHSEVSVEQASAVAAKVASSVREASYVVRNMMEIAGEESSQWIATDTIAAGEMSINGTAYAEFDEPIIFEAGNKYMITINAEDADEFKESVDFIINGAYVEPFIDQLVLINGAEEYALNTHSAVSVEAQTAMTVSFDAAVKTATYAITPIVGYDEETGDPLLGVPTWGEFSINTTGYAEQNYAYKQGVQYMITIEATLMDDTEASEQFIVNGAYVAEPLAATISGEGTELNIIYAVGTDLGDNYAVKPYILDADNQKIEVSEYEIDNTTGGFFDPLNKIIITLNEALADGKYTLVLPEGMFIVNGGDNNDQWEYSFGANNSKYAGIASAVMEITEAGWATFCAPFEVEIPEGVDAYSVDDVKASNALVLTPVGPSIPANWPVVLYAENGLEKTTFEGYADKNPNGKATHELLTGVYEETTAPWGSYVLENHDGKVGFYKVESEIKVPANRAYFIVPAPEANERAFFFDVETAIATIEALTSGKAEIYNVNGVKINRLQKGINIVNGKKVMVK